MKPKTFYVYIMSNYKRSVVYTGVTSDLFKRVYEHKHHMKGKFTDKYNCTILVYFEETNDAMTAFNREKEIKGWKRIKKDNLIMSKNVNWSDLAEGWYS